MFTESFSFEIPFHYKDFFMIKIRNTEVYPTSSYVFFHHKIIQYILWRAGPYPTPVWTRILRLKNDSTQIYANTMYVVCLNKIIQYLLWRAHNTQIYIFIISTVRTFVTKQNIYRKMYSAYIKCNTNIIHTKNIVRIPKRYYLKNIWSNIHTWYIVLQ